MRVLSGIQPTGELHLGNYLGAIKTWLSLQEKAECIFPIVDLHALTVPYSPQQFQKLVMETVISYLACGIDPEKSLIFIQSEVPQHCELCWLLSTLTPLGELSRMTQFKEKRKELKKAVNAGLFCYPILMAADILLYRAEIVPVGKDQLQHLEFAREIARRFNSRFGKTLVEPQALVPKWGGKIMSLADPKKKMSKSLGEKHYLSLFAEPEEIRAKITEAVTDPGKEIKFSPQKKPGISNLILIYSLFSERTIKEVEREFKGKGYQFFKEALSQLLIEKLKPFRKKRKELLSREVYLREILDRGQKKAREIASLTLNEVKRKMGLI
jgi:tryptophanyl-tRNA synthetase